MNDDKLKKFLRSNDVFVPKHNSQSGIDEAEGIWQTINQPVVDRKVVWLKRATPWLIAASIVVVGFWLTRPESQLNHANDTLVRQTLVDSYGNWEAADREDPMDDWIDLASAL